MTYEEFKEYLKDQVLEDKVVRMRTRYGTDGDWDYENEILMVNDMEYEWLSDWCEGQDQVEILGCIEVSDIKVPLFESNSDEDCISREWVLEHQRIFVDDDGIMLPVVDVSIVKKAPSVQPKPKYVAVGNVNFDKDELQKIVDEAIPTIMPEIEYRKAHWQNNACSNCGIYNASAYKNWCPNCGYQMTEEIE